MSTKKILTIVFSLLVMSVVSLAQTSESSVGAQLEEVIKKSGTFKTYKVIPIDKLNVIVNTVKDSISGAKKEIVILNDRISEKQSEVDELAIEINTLTGNLNESNALNESIVFLGIPFKKTTYNLMVWGIIFAFAALAGFAYLMFKRSNIVTRKTKKDLQELMSEFEAHKSRSNERQVKLKRELQTAINTINERGLKV